MSDPARLSHYEQVDGNIEKGCHEHRPDRVVELPLISPSLDSYLLYLFCFFVFFDMTLFHVVDGRKELVDLALVLGCLL
jgi:hypothetical protein